MTTATGTDKQFKDLLNNALREAGLQPSQDNVEQIWGYLQNQNAHIHFGDDSSSTAWQSMAESAVRTEGKGGAQMIRTATSDRDGGFAYVCLGEPAAQELIRELEKQVGSRR